MQSKRSCLNLGFRQETANLLRKQFCSGSKGMSQWEKPGWEGAQRAVVLGGGGVVVMRKEPANPLTAHVAVFSTVKDVSVLGGPQKQCESGCFLHHLVTLPGLCLLFKAHSVTLSYAWYLEPGQQASPLWKKLHPPPSPSLGHGGKVTEGPGGWEEATIAAYVPFKRLMEWKLSFACQVIKTWPGGIF